MARKVKFTKDDMLKAAFESARYANFAQRIKMKYWLTGKAPHLSEGSTDDLLLVVWSELLAEEERKRGLRP